MPIHLSSLTSKNNDSELLASLLQGALEHSDAAVVSEDRNYLQIAQFLHDVISGERIGKLVYTMFRNEAERSLCILDIDIMLDSENTVELLFLNKLPASSDANEYYEIEVLPEGQHLQIETVNRYLVRHELENTIKTVKTCAFPFRMSVYDNMCALDRSLGLNEQIIGPLGITLGGLSETFAAPGSFFSPDGGEVFSFLVGTVKTFRDVEVRFGEHPIRFVIAQLDSALGLLPTAMGRDVFKLDSLAPGKIIAMSADIKADFAVQQ